MTQLRELSVSEASQVNGGEIFSSGAAGGALGGLLATGTLEGAAFGSGLGLAAAASFTIGYGIGGAINEYTGASDWLADQLWGILN